MRFMTKEEIEKLITSYIQQSRGGLQIKNPKFDFKEQWYTVTEGFVPEKGPFHS